MRKTVYALAASAILLIACGHSKLAIPDPTVPHKVAKETQVIVWCRLPDGQMVKCPVRILPGWWIAGPPVIEPE